MRVEWYDPAGWNYQINSDNPNLIAEWLKELVVKYAEQFRNTAYPPPRLSFWPSGDYNYSTWSEYQLTPMTYDTLLWIIEGFRKINNGEMLKPSPEFRL